MSTQEPRTFATGPDVLHPTLGLALVAACLLLAGAQAWAASRHYLGAGGPGSAEAAARIVFGALFLFAGAGIAIALLARRNAAVRLDEAGLTIRSWRGTRRRLQFDEVAALVRIAPDREETDFPFHSLRLLTTDGRSLRLAGGPWPAPEPVQALRRELVDRLGLEEHASERARWLIFPAQRTEWT